jgi:hypothetical protein
MDRASFGRRTIRLSTTATNVAGPEATLAKDERGVVMFIGIFMALFLTGALWFIVGIGDAIVYREAAQEASDAAAFSSAAIHAKGMNIIAFLNCLMLAITFIYLVLALAVDAILFITGLAAAGIVTLWAVPELVAAAKEVDNVAGAYKRGMSVTLPTFAAVQTGVAYLAPWGSTIAAGGIAKKYGFLALALGPSHIIGADSSTLTLIDTVSRGRASTVLPPGSGRHAAFSAATAKLGLPVTSQSMNALCNVAVAFVVDKLFALLGRIPLAGKFLGAARNFVSGFLGPKVTELHCREPSSGAPFDPKDLYDKKPPRGLFSAATRKLARAATSAIGSLAGRLFNVYAAETWWGSTRGGPKAVYGLMTNGSEWSQIWTYTPATYDDEQDGRVRIATYRGGTFRGARRETGGASLYTAQSEFYFDCRGFYRWSSEHCNGKDQYDYTMYSLRWRSRLVRFRGFGISTVGTLFGDFVASFLTNSSFTGWIKKKLDLAGRLERSALPKIIKGLLLNDGKNGKGADLFDRSVKLVVDKAHGALKPTRLGARALH